MTYCPCCGGDVPRATKVRHLRAHGWQNVKNYVEMHHHNLTSRVLQTFRKRKRPGGDSEGEDEAEPPSKVLRAGSSQSPVHSDSPSPEPCPDMDIDQGNLPPLPPTTLPTTRPRLVTVETYSSTGSESDNVPSLTVIDDDDLDPELDESLLTQVKLTPHELLDGYLESEESRRDCRLTDTAMDSIRAHNAKVSIDLGARAYEKLKRAFPQLRDLPTLCQLQSEITFLSGVNPVKYDCCKESCCCFVGPYADLDECLYCSAARYDSQGCPRATFEYLPLIPRLKAMFADKAMCEQLGYRARYEMKGGKIRDIFDSFQYRRLQGRHVRIQDEVFAHRFFDQDTDIAIGLSADGVCPFKNRKATCWPLIGVLYNLNPELRFLLDHVLCFGVIPGPKEPKDLDSFLIPLRDELWRLMHGEAAYNVERDEKFLLRAYLIRVFGDMPAMAKLMRMRGPNAKLPCRACKIEGLRNIEGGGKTNYCPLRRPNGECYDPYKLPLRTHDEFIADALQVDSAFNDAEAERRGKATGQNGLPILATLSSLSFPDSFGHDLMHLIPENVVKNLITLWIDDDFKGLDTGVEDYRLEPAAVDAIGAACVVAGDTTPSVFGARVPNLATQRHYFTAESYTLFTTLLGPVILRNRFSKPKYYKHFLDLVAIFNDCLSMSIDREYVDTTLRKNIVDWVEKYEKYYYQYDASRLSVCVLTLHAILHIPDDILNAGPMWCYWNYITERYVGYLVRCSKSRRNPYASFARRLREIAQNSVIKFKYQLHSKLDLSDKHEEQTAGHTPDNYPGICVLKPCLRSEIAPAVRKAIEKYFLLTFDVDAVQARSAIPAEVLHWGKISFLNGGDKIRSADLVKQSEGNMTRDASFIKFYHEIDKNRNHRRMPVDLVRTAAYGQLLRVLEFVADLPVLTDDNGKQTQRPRTVLLAVVRPVKEHQKSRKLGTAYYQDGQLSPIQVVDVDDLSCLVARIPSTEAGPRKWALSERHDAMGVSPEEAE